MLLVSRADRWTSVPAIGTIVHLMAVVVDHALSTSSAHTVSDSASWIRRTPTPAL